MEEKAETGAVGYFISATVVLEIIEMKDSHRAESNLLLASGDIDWRWQEGFSDGCDDVLQLIHHKGEAIDVVTIPTLKVEQTMDMLIEFIETKPYPDDEADYDFGYAIGTIDGIRQALSTLGLLEEDANG